ncbi:site-2 protease family protein [Candidatus Micrarchaeota archaeon]|nr:site-2 protease family protein [Candidatus Micrarchaeota archaeon]
MVMKFEENELLHIAVSVITISLAFSLYAGTFWLILATLGLGFILHELAHKYVAQSYGAFAVYRAWTFGLLLALGLAIFTEGKFIFAAPGAVVIFGRHLTQKQNGKIAIAGSVTNFALSLIFLSVAYAGIGYEDLARTGAYINAFLGAFNMIPIAPLDGQKVQAWSESAWLAITAACWGLLFLLMFGVI